MRRLLAEVLIGAFMVVMASAALLKAADAEEFRNVLTTTWLVPRGPAAILTVLIPVAEASIATAWFLRVGRRAAIIYGALLLSFFTIAFIWLWILRAPPTCGCFGQLKMFEDTQHAAMWTVVRNVGLLTMLAIGGALGWRHFGDSSVTDPEQTPNANPRFHTH